MHRRPLSAALAGTMLAHWLWVGRPLVGLGVASLVLAGERVSAAGFTLVGGFDTRLAGAGATVAVGAILYGLSAGTPTGGVAAASLVLLTTWLSGPAPPSLTHPLPYRDAGSEPRPADE